MMQRWRKESRYFTTHLAQDLFGDWILTRCWGDLHKGSSQSRRDLFDNREAANAQLKQIGRLRRRQGYVPVADPQLNALLPK